MRYFSNAQHFSMGNGNRDFENNARESLALRNKCLLYNYPQGMILNKK